MCNCKCNENLTIKIKYHHSDYPPLRFVGGHKSDWVDLYTSEEVKLIKGQYQLINLGVSMELPEGYEAYILPRSSTYKNFGLIQSNSQAVIDESYKGDNDVWKYPVISSRDIVVPKHTRLCQFRIQKKMPRIEFIKVESLENSDRGGFGSTGK